MECAICGLKVPSDENVCPRCGNVFRKVEGELSSKTISKDRTVKKSDLRNASVEKGGQH